MNEDKKKEHVHKCVVCGKEFSLDIGDDNLVSCEGHSFGEIVAKNEQYQCRSYVENGNIIDCTCGECF